MEFSNPWALLGLLAAPLLWWWGRARLGQSRRWLGAVTLGLRGGFLLLMIGALAMPMLLLPERRTDWLILIDHSHSIDPAALDWAREIVEQANGDKSAGDRLGVISFGADSSLDLTFDETLSGQTFGETVDGSATHLEFALQAALAEFEDKNRQRIVLLSDGNETAGHVQDAVGPLVSRGIRVTAIAPAVRAGGEVVLENILLPATAKRGDEITAEVVVTSTQPAQAVLQIFHDAAPLGQFQVRLQKGRNIFPVTFTAETEGQKLFRAVIDSAQDRRPENNRFERFLAVEGGSKVLLISGEEADSKPLVDALELQKLRITVGGLANIPATLQELLQYDLVIFDNAPGLSLSREQMEMLESYVRDFGGGFVMIGGEHSFGGGGYHETPLEAMLPVDMEIDNEVKMPTVALVLVIDRSDSMGSDVGLSTLGGSKLEVAKLASFSAMQLLNPTDRVGLVAFDTKALWIVPMIEAGKREVIAAQLSGLKVGGGTDLFVGLNLAVEHLSLMRAHKKHIIALSDGLTPVRRFEELVKSAAGSRVTVSTVALGDNADQFLLRKLAGWGNGRFYFTNDPMKIPRIFTTETIMVTQGLIEELDFIPEVRVNHEILEGISLEALPPLHGYVVTAPKASAEVVLTAPDDDPLLAVRQYGLGRSVAFTSDLTTGWGKSWVEWSEFPRVVTQMMRWAARRGGEGNIELALTLNGEHASVVADLFDEEGHYLNRFALEGTVTYPDRSLRNVALRQEAPGRYRGEFPLTQSGEYLFNVTGRRDGVTVGPKSVGITVPYGAEYRMPEPDTALLSDLAERTSGEFLSGDRVEEALAEIMAAEGGELVRKPIWPYLILLGMILFLIDIALRQLGWLPRQQEEDAAAQAHRPPAAAVDLEAAVAHRAASSHRRGG
ncbi:MAG: VWA domain-containing protein [SAR324 cluster bacterium]|nr:VWA domain-containing protein [SAR324 cluster bacterium]